MRARVIVSSAFFLSLFLLPAQMRAQFQQPTQEELTMTSDPNAPGADAIYLYDEEIDNDPLHFQSVYVRIKVLTEKGKALSVVELPYVRGYREITDIKARTIHADGTVIPLEGKPESLLSTKNSDAQIARRVFNLPKVEVGSILEYRYTVRYDDYYSSSPFWHVQKKYPVRKAHYSFTPFEAFIPGPKGQASTITFLIDPQGNIINTLMCWQNLPHGAKVKSDIGGHYLVDVENVPPIPHEEWMPPVKSVLYRVFFYYKADWSAQEFWNNSAKGLAKEIDKFATPGPALRDAVAKLVGANDSEMVKAAKIYKAVQALENTEYSRGMTESERKTLKLKDIKRADDVWAQKSGNRKEIAGLYLAMLRAAGMKAYPVTVVNRDEGIFDPRYMDIRQLDDMLVSVYADGKMIVTDPGEKMCAFKSLAWKHAEVHGLSVNETSPTLLTTPAQAYKQNTTMRTGHLTLDAQGGVTGVLQYTLAGQAALNLRQFALTHDLDELKEKLDKGLVSELPRGVEAHVERFLGLENSEANLLAFVKVEGQLATVTAKRLILPGFFFEANGHRPFVDQAVRTQAVDMHYAEQVVDRVHYQIPAGYSLEGVPEEAHVSWVGHAVYTAKIQQTAPNEVVATRQLARVFSTAKPEEYQELRGFYQKVAAADQQQLTLASSATTEKGN